MTILATPGRLDIQADAYLYEQYMASGEPSDAEINRQIRALRELLPRKTILLYAWHVARALHPERRHDGLDGVRKRVFGGDRKAINRAHRQLVAYRLIDIQRYNDDEDHHRYELVIVKPPWYTQRGTAALR